MILYTTAILSPAGSTENTLPHIDGSAAIRGADFWFVCKQQIATYGFAVSENNQIACATTKHSQALRIFYWLSRM
ncbi:hypothetical protein [Mesorhizobium wenxiniae]|uniref:hypothetical protein n=1 Tax=Mesorhizobium wenxiniae TaxID=2014805 RepID=UPI0013FE219E|nr:hypothetical protein [Mesorhizobium wenxiniae]